MALPANALVTLEEFKDHAGIPVDMHTIDSRLENEIIGPACSWIERRTRRTLVFQATDYTEFHTFDRPRSFFYTRHYPILTITSLNEDTNRQFLAGEALVEDTNFLVHKERGKIIQVSAGSAYPLNFIWGIDHIKIVYSAGFTKDAERTNVPAEWKWACNRIAVRLWREIDRKEQGMSAKSDQLGNVTKIDDRMVPIEVMEFIMGESRPGGFLSTHRE